MNTTQFYGSLVMKLQRWRLEYLGKAHKQAAKERQALALRVRADALPELRREREARGAALRVEKALAAHRARSAECRRSASTSAAVCASARKRSDSVRLWSTRSPRAARTRRRQ